MSVLTESQNQKAEEIFNSVNKNGSGFIHSNEFYEACQLMGLSYSFGEAFQIYKNYDQNVSISWDLQEFKRFYADQINTPNTPVDMTNHTHQHANAEAHQFGEAAYEITQQPQESQPIQYAEQVQYVEQPQQQQIIHEQPMVHTTTTSSTRLIQSNHTTEGIPAVATRRAVRVVQAAPTTTTENPVRSSHHSHTYVQQAQPVYTTQPPVTTTTTHHTATNVAATPVYAPSSRVVYSNQQQPSTTSYVQGTTTYASPSFTNGQQPIYRQQQPSSSLGTVQYQNAQNVASSYVRPQVRRSDYNTVVGGAGWVDNYTPYQNEMKKYDTQGKGYLSREDLRVACQDLAVKCGNDQELENLFREIDINCSGRISAYEFGEFYDYVKDFRNQVMEQRSK